MDFKNLKLRSNDELIDLYFDYIGDSNFIRALEEFSIGNGFGLLDVGCEFAHNFEEWEEGYFGEKGVQILFSNPLLEEDEEFEISAKEFFDGIKRAVIKFGLCNAYYENLIKLIEERIK
ncbi:ribonuclease toxin immunity protein CdiI [Neobacillus drentensis]|uniref:ribonuclease toxin immunity protein CdiI n=1 Tax=Neobacillus drentensis TaxID=220684 RepID=UPI002FFE5719